MVPAEHLSVLPIAPQDLKEMPKSLMDDGTFLLIEGGSQSQP